MNSGMVVSEHPIIWKNQGFKFNSKGDFTNPYCRALEKAVSDIPANETLVVQVNAPEPFSVFRKNLIIDTFRSLGVPEIKWQDVPDDKRAQAVFDATLAVPGRERGRRDYLLFDRPKHYYAPDGSFLTFVELQAAIAAHPQDPPAEPEYVRRYPLNDFYTIYDIAQNAGLRDFSVRSMQSWREPRDPFFGARDYFILPLITLRHRFPMGEAEFSMGDPILSAEDNVALILREGNNLFLVSSRDRLRFGPNGDFSLKITQFMIPEFANAESLFAARKSRDKLIPTFGIPQTVCRIILTHETPEGQ